MRDGRGLAIVRLTSVPAGDEKSEEDVETAETGGEKPVAPGDGAEDGEASEQHE